MISRRKFLEGTTAAAALSMTAKSYARIAGANERVHFAIIGLHNRAYAHLASLKANAATSQVTHVCDVDSVILAKYVADATKALGYAPAADGDFRRVLEPREVDAVTIATPEHWHAPMAIAALKAGKHVYVEKPCSYNPHEGEMLVAAQKKYGKLVQMGSQQRSSPHTIEIVQMIHDGLIGKTTFGRAWYTNNRKPIGIGHDMAPPPTLDWELWQGPAPRRAYRSNLHPYNWHWFKLYGTGETLNNGTHEVDVCRWAMGVDFPNSVSATGGRYNAKDDWEFYDTLETSFAYDECMISWEGRSCQIMKVYNRDRGAIIFGTKGSVIIDRDGYDIFDNGGVLTRQYRIPGQTTASADVTGADSMTDHHFANFIAGIRTGESLRAPVATGNVAVTMLQLSNIAWETGRTLHLDAGNGHIVNDPKAEAMTRREYQKGWELSI